MNQAIIQQSIARVMPAVRATGLQSALATFQSASQDFSTGMAPNTWTNVAGLVDIAGQFGPETDMSVVANEQRTQPMITATNLHRLELDDFYPTIDPGWRNGYRVLVDGLPYDISGVEHDSQSQVTRLCVKDVTI